MNTVLGHPADDRRTPGALAVQRERLRSANIDSINTYLWMEWDDAVAIVCLMLGSGVKDLKEKQTFCFVSSLFLC